MSPEFKSPDDINKERGHIVYRCRACYADKDLVWFNGTSCPVCRKPDCAKVLWQEYDDARKQIEEEENW